jgi:hypothetical protein
MTDAGFVIAAYVGILGAWAAYALWVVRRLARSRRADPPSDTPRPGSASDGS